MNYYENICTNLKLEGLCKQGTRIADIPSILERQVRSCGVCIFYSDDLNTDYFCMYLNDRDKIRDYEDSIEPCLWNLTIDEFNQIYDPYIM